MTKAIIFDLTQTLQVFNFARMQKEFKKILQKMPSCRKIQTKKFMLAYQQAYDSYQIGKIKNDNDFTKKIFSQLQVQPSKKEISFFMREHKQCRKKFIRLPTGIKTTLFGLKKSGFKLGMLSNCVYNWLAFDWQFLHFKPKQFFAAEVSSQQTGIKKPDARAYKLILQKLRVKARDATMVGDNYEHDVLAPQKLGIKTIWLNKKSKRKKADFAIKEFRELSKIKKALLND